jgi:hypothetical protein
VTPKAVKFVSFARIEDHFREGWLIMFPNAPMHHHCYGVELAWICDCQIPGLKNSVYHNRVPFNTKAENEDERTASRA